MPNLKGRYDHSISKGESPRPVVEVMEVERVYAPCGGGCSRQVAPGQKCPECAAQAVDEWVAGRKLLAGRDGRREGKRK